MIEIDVGDCDLTTFARAEPEEPKNPSKRHLKFPKNGSISEAAGRSPIRVGWDREVNSGEISADQIANDCG